MKKQRKENGITLIALVITIIILIILAGISIGMLVGDNGIITKAKQAKQDTEVAQEEQDKSLTNMEEYIKEQINETSSLPEDTGKPELQSLKMLVNAGSDGFLQLGIPTDAYSTDTIIDWGDGTVQDYNAIIAIAKKTNKEIKLASITPMSEIKVASGLPTIDHTYAQKNKEYTITITGTWKHLEIEMSSREKLLEIVQWGTTKLENIVLENSNNLKKIAEPTKNSFINMSNFDYTFNSCLSLQAIPENLFANCPNVTSFRNTFGYCHKITKIPENLFMNCPNATNFLNTFANCTGLTSIPQNLFANCLKVESFSGTFWGCQNLTGNPIALWERVPNGEKNGYVGIPDGESCYSEATKLNGYNTIPEYWKAGMPS